MNNERRARSRAGPGASALVACLCVLDLSGSAVAQDPGAAGRIAQRVRDLDSPTIEVWQRAMEELAGLGSAAVPPLIERLGSGDDDDDHGRLRAIRVLGRVGKPAARSVPHMLELLGDDTSPNLQMTIATTLCSVGPHAPDHGAAIRKAMDRAIWKNRAQFSLTRQQSFGMTLVGPDLVRAHARTLLDVEASSAEIARHLQGTNPFVREFAAELLAVHGKPDDETIAALAQALEQEHPTIVSRSVANPVGAGPGKKKAAAAASAPAPIDYPVYLTRRIHRLAARALLRIAPSDPRSIPAHVFSLRYSGYPQQRRSARFLASLGPRAAAAVPALIELIELTGPPEPTGLTRPMGEAGPRVRHEAVKALGEIGPAARSAAPALRRLTRARDAGIADLARAALARLEVK